MRRTLSVAAIVLLSSQFAVAHDEPPASQPTAQPTSQPSTQPTTQPILTVGDPAPPLDVERWIKGKPVTTFEPGTIYVVEFWATWCGPCIDAMPDLTMLQAKYPKVVFIGVDVAEENPARVDPFVKREGARMDYRVAADVSPAEDEHGETAHGPVYNAWMFSPDGERGLPTAFVVDGHGKIIRTGHPGSLAPELKAIVEGRFDPEVKRRAQPQVEALYARYSDGWKRKDYAAALAALDGVVSVDPYATADDVAVNRLELLVAGGDLPAASALYENILRAGERGDIVPSEIDRARFIRLDLLCAQRDAPALNAHIAALRKLWDDEGRRLNRLAWTLVGGPPDAGFRALSLDMDLVLGIANDANIAATGQDVQSLDTLARVHAVRGEFELAARTEALAVDLEKDKALRISFAKSLAAYQSGREE